MNGDAFLPEAEEILENFNEEIQTYGIGSIGELFDADPPYSPRGAISQACSVGAVLDIYAMIQARKANQTEEPKKKVTRRSTAKATKTESASTARKATTAKSSRSASKSAETKEAQTVKKSAAKRPAAKKTTAK